MRNKSSGEVEAARSRFIKTTFVLLSYLFPFSGSTWFPGNPVSDAPVAGRLAPYRHQGVTLTG